MKFAAMFISYDGLLDPLGGSQILPYLRGIAGHPRPLHVVSFEKPDRFAAGGDELKAELLREGIDWTPLSFTKRFGKLGKAWDLLRMCWTCLRLQHRHAFAVVHCRSYPPMQVAYLLGRLTGVRTIFDMRGLWPDERVDGGLWPQDRLTNRLTYRLYKRLERQLLSGASHVIVLTERVVPELRRLVPHMSAAITVIPCCADFEHFVRPGEAERLALRAAFGVSPDGLLLSYLGSLGTWYMLNEMLRAFAAAARRRDDVHMLFITRDWTHEHEALIASMNIVHLRDRIHIRGARREEVPALLGASDIMLSFIRPTYSKIASSPTKLAEALALGVPVISNAGVGDVDRLTRELDAGAVFELGDATAFEALTAALDDIRAKGGSGLRARARERLGLEVAHLAYRRVYEEIERLSLLDVRHRERREKAFGSLG